MAKQEQKSSSSSSRKKKGVAAATTATAKTNAKATIVTLPEAAATATTSASARRRVEETRSDNSTAGATAAAASLKKKSTFRQRRSLREAALNSAAALQDEEECNENEEDSEDEDEATAATDRTIPGAFRAGSSSLRGSNNNNATQEDDLVSVTSRTQANSSGSEIEAAFSADDDGNSNSIPVEAKVVDDSVVEAEVQARVQAELNQRILVEAVANDDDNDERKSHNRFCLYAKIGFIPLVVIAIVIALITGSRRDATTFPPTITEEYGPPSDVPSDMPSQSPSQSLAPSVSPAPSEAPSIPGPPSVSLQPSSAPSNPLQVQLVRIEVDLSPYSSGSSLTGYDMFIFQSVTEQFIEKYLSYPNNTLGLENLAVSAQIRKQTYTQFRQRERQLHQRELQQFEGSLFIECDVMVRFQTDEFYLDMNAEVFYVFQPLGDDYHFRSNEYLTNLQSNSTALASIQWAYVNVKNYIADAGPEGDVMGPSGFWEDASFRAHISPLSLLLVVMSFLWLFT